MIFKERIEELLRRFPIPDPNAKVNLQLFSKWRVQAKCLLALYLGEEHPYTKELSTMLVAELDPYSVGSHILMAKGILEGLTEDIDSGLIQINERQRQRVFQKHKWWSSRGTKV